MIMPFLNSPPGDQAALQTRRGGGLRVLLAITGLAVLTLVFKPEVKANQPVCNCKASDACRPPQGGGAEICAVDCSANGGSDRGICSVP